MLLKTLAALFSLLWQTLPTPGIGNQVHGGGGTITFINSSCSGSGTISALNMTGATTYYVTATDNLGTAVPSNGVDTFNLVSTASETSGSPSTRTFVASTSGGGSVTFTFAGVFPGFCVAGFSGSLGTLVTGTGKHFPGTLVSSIQAGSMTSGAGSQLVLAGLGMSGATTFSSIGSGFSATCANFNPGVSYGDCIAYFLQGSGSTSYNPPWTMSGSTNVLNAISAIFN